MLRGGQNPSSARNHRMYRLPACAGNAKLPGPAIFGKVLGYFRVVLQMFGFIMVAHWVACIWWARG